MGNNKAKLVLICTINFLVGYFFATEMDHMKPLAKEVIGSAVSRDLMSVSTTTTANLRSSNNVAVLSDASTTTSRRTQFDRIFQKAYKEATSSTFNAAKLPKRNKFDIDYWEKESNLITEGGLQREDRILLSQLYSNAESVFEYGLGESTYMANYVGVPRYAGIDSDPVWVDMARNRVASHYRFYFADIGKTGRWGMPDDESLPKNVLDYQLEPLAVEQEPFDVYMVDGRYRLACALASFLHASARGGDPTQTTVLIHDCHKMSSEGTRTVANNDRLTWEGRDVYHKADHLLEMVNHSGNRLCVFKRKPETTDEQIADLYMEFATNSKR